MNVLFDQVKARLKPHLLPILCLLSAHLILFGKFIFLNPSGAPSLILHWDFNSQYYPWLVYSSDVLHAGSWPLWCPYVGGGAPFFINPQTQLYSPLTILIATTIGYTQYVAQLQTFFFVFLAGLGSYLLCWSLFRSRLGALLTAISFSLSVAVYGNLEHSTYINAFALMPVIFWLTLKAVRDEARWAAPALAIAIFQDIVTGYPAIVAMTLAWGTLWALFLLRRHPTRAVRKGAYLAIACVVALGLSAVDWLPIVYYHDQFTRGTPLSPEVALDTGSLSYKHLWELLFQFLTVFPLPGANPDVSMRGLYVGILALPLAAVGAAWRRDGLSWALVGFSTLAFLMACGSNFAGRVALHHLLPLLNYSRFPAGDSRTLFALGLCLLAGRGLQLLTLRDRGARRIATGSATILWLMIASGLLWLPPLVAGELSGGLVRIDIGATLLLLAGGLPLLWHQQRRWAQALLIGLVLADLAFALKVNIRVAGEEPRDYGTIAAQHQAIFDTRLAMTPRLPGWRKSLEDIDSCEPANSGFLDKHFYLGEYNPLRLKALDHLDEIGLTHWMLNGPRLVVVPGQAAPASVMEFLSRAATPTFQVLNYRPNEVDYRIALKAPALVVFNETYFPGWRLREGAQDVPMTEVLGGLRAATLGPGEHVIRTYFAPRGFYLGLRATMGTLFALIAAMALLVARSRSGRRVRNDQAPGEAA